MRVSTKLKLQAAVATGLGWLTRAPDAVRVLTFHSVQAAGDAMLHQPPTMFEAQVRCLAERGYRTLTVGQAVERWPDSLSAQHAIVLTFDDGYANHRTVVAEILKKYRLTATFFIPTAFIGERRQEPAGDTFTAYRPIEMLSWSDLRELSREGFEIGAHSHSHVMVGQQTREQAREQVTRPKRLLEDKLGVEVRSFAYPKGRRGAFAEWTRALLAEAGYAAGCTTIEGRLTPSSDPLELPRIGIQAADDLRRFEMKIEGRYDLLRWFRR